jgi:glutamate-1-semialdehyde aminotransferase
MPDSQQPKTVSHPQLALPDPPPSLFTQPQYHAASLGARQLLALQQQQQRLDHRKPVSSQQHKPATEANTEVVETHHKQFHHRDNRQQKQQQNQPNQSTNAKKFPLAANQLPAEVAVEDFTGDERNVGDEMSISIEKYAAAHEQVRFSSISPPPDQELLASQPHSEYNVTEALDALSLALEDGPQQQATQIKDKKKTTTTAATT